jgi:hypothetical protein
MYATPCAIKLTNCLTLFRNVKLIHDKQQKTEAELELVKACNTKLMTWTIDVSTTLATMEQLVAKLETEVQQVQSLFR